MKENHEFKVYLGKTKGARSERVYLTGFKWDCGWYWGGGYIHTKSMHTHFDGCFLNSVDVRGHSLGNFVSPWFAGMQLEGKVISNGASVWENLDFFLDDAKFSQNEWWRIKDLYRQFYTFTNAAEAFQYGGHCTSGGRSDGEIDTEKAAIMNAHIEKVIIPEILKALKVEVCA